MPGQIKPGVRLEYKANPRLYRQMREILTDAILEFGGEVEERAKHNVSPGVGPGPHPHRADHGWHWEDTGDLRDDVRAEPYEGAHRVGVLVGAWTLAYGRHLEEGFHGPSGRFYRYPWLIPALDAARPSLPGIIRRGVHRKERLYGSGT